MNNSVLMGFTPESLKRLENTLHYMRLSANNKKLMMKKVLERLKKRAQKNIQNQTSPDGKAWEGRRKKIKGGKLKQRMLRYGSRYLNTSLEKAGEVGRLHYEKEKTSRIFYEHHTGAELPVKQTKEDEAILEKILAENKENATPAQIRRLKELGYQVSAGKYKNGKRRYKNVTKKNINRGRAGLIIRYLEEKKGIKIRRNLKSYKMPKRKFLDEDEKRNADIITEELFKAFEREGIHLTL